MSATSPHVPPFLVLARDAQIALLVIANRSFDEEEGDPYLQTENVYRFSGFASREEAERTGKRIAEFSEAESSYQITYEVIESRPGEIWAWVGTDRERTTRGEGALTYGALGRIIPVPEQASAIFEYLVSEGNTDPDEQLLRDCLTFILRPAPRSREALLAEMVTRLEGEAFDVGFRAGAVLLPGDPEWGGPVLLSVDARCYRLPAMPAMPND